MEALPHCILISTTADVWYQTDNYSFADSENNVLAKKDSFWLTEFKFITRV